MDRADLCKFRVESPLNRLANSAVRSHWIALRGALLSGCRQRPTPPIANRLPALGEAWQRWRPNAAAARSTLARAPLGAATTLSAAHWTVRSHTPAWDLRCSAVPVGRHWLLTSAHCIAGFRQDGEPPHPIGPPVPAEISVEPRNTTADVAVPPDRNGRGTDLMALRVAEPLSRWAAHRGINQVKPEERLHRRCHGMGQWSDPKPDLVTEARRTPGARTTGQFG